MQENCSDHRKTQGCQWEYLSRIRRPFQKETCKKSSFIWKGMVDFLKLWLFAHLSHLSSKKSTKSCDIYSRAFLIMGIQCSLLDGVCFYKQELRLLMFLWVS